MSRVREKLDLQSGRGRVVDVEEHTPHHEMPNGGGHPLGALGAQGSSAKHGDGVSGNARREVRQGAELGSAREDNQGPPRRNTVGQVQLLLSEGALQTGAESIRDPKVVSPGQVARVRVQGQPHSQAPGQGSTHAAKPATQTRTSNLVIGPKVPALCMGQERLDARSSQHCGKDSRG